MNNVIHEQEVLESEYNPQRILNEIRLHSLFLSEDKHLLKLVRQHNLHNYYPEDKFVKTLLFHGIRDCSQYIPIQTFVSIVVTNMGSVTSKSFYTQLYTLIIESSLFDVEKTLRGKYRVKFVHDNPYIKELQIKLNKVSYMPPMVAKPLPLSEDTTGLYTRNTPVFLSKSRYVKKLPKLSNKVKQVINILQGTPLQLIDNTRPVPLSNTAKFLSEELRFTSHKNAVRYQVHTKLYQNSYSNKPFHFLWRLDLRGRLYTSGYHINFQSDDYRKSQIGLYDPDQYHIKGSVNYTLLNNRYSIKEVVNHYKQGLKSDDVWSTMNSNLLNEDKTNKKGIMVSIDAKASGIQLMAILSRCLDTANLVGFNHSTEDPYDVFSQYMNNHIGEQFFVRKDMKKSVMTSFYNSVATPLKLFGNNRQLMRLFERGKADLLPGATDIQEKVNALYKPAKYHTWHLPNGMECKIPSIVLETQHMQIKDLHFTYKRKVVKSSKDNFRSLLPNIIHSIDAYVMSEVVLKAHELGIPVYPIHDCFYTLPQFINEVRAIYIEVLLQLYDMNLLDSIFRELTNDKVGYEPINTLKPEHIIGCSDNIIS